MGDKTEELGSIGLATAFSIDDALAGAAAFVAPDLEAAIGAFETVGAFTGPVGIGVSAAYGGISGGWAGALKETIVSSTAYVITGLSDSVASGALASALGEGVGAAIAGVGSAGLGLGAALLVGGVYKAVTGIAPQQGLDSARDAVNAGQSAIGRQLFNQTLNSDTTPNETSTAVTAIDGSIVTTTTNDIAAKAVAPLSGRVLWSSAIATSNKTVASKVINTVSADGLSKTVQADYDGNGTYEHTESWQTQIDGSQIGIIQDVNSSGAVIAKGTETISADGLTTTLKEDSHNSGLIDHIDAATTHVDGSITETVSDYNSNGTLKQATVTYATADGQSTSVITTTPPASSGALATSATLITGSSTTTTESNSIDTATSEFNVLTVTSGQETVSIAGSTSGSTTSTGGGNLINVEGTASLTAVGGPAGGAGNVIDYSSSSNALNAKDWHIALEDGRNIALSGTLNTGLMRKNDTVTLTKDGGVDQNGQLNVFVFQQSFGHASISNLIEQKNFTTLVRCRRLVAVSL